MLSRRTTTDIAIVGAGPAGARAAELLSAGGADVRLIDPRAPWEKPCGGGLTEPVFREFPELEELAGAMQVVRAMRIEDASGAGSTIPLDTPIRIVARRTLARWQLDRALASGARHVRERVRFFRRMGERWYIETERASITADVILGADGAASLVRRTLSPKFRVELAPTRVQYPAGTREASDTLYLRLFPRVAGYVWDFPRRDHRSVGIGIQAGAWKRPRMDRAIEDFRRSGRECMCAEPPVAGAVIGTAQLGHGDFSAVGGAHFALLGDAAGFADPTTGEGIRNALRSARLAADVWLGEGSLARYPALARRSFEREFNVSRVLRRVLFEGEMGAHLVDGLGDSVLRYALVGALADAVNEHDGSVTGMLRRIWSRWREARLDPDTVTASMRVASPCECGCTGEQPSASAICVA